MNSAWSGRCDTDTQPTCEFGISARGERRSLFVANLDEADLILVRTESPENSIHAIARKTEDHFDMPCDQSFH